MGIRILGLLGLLFTSVSYGLDKTVYMTSLHWPPYTGKELLDQGRTIKQAKQVFTSMGYQLEVDFFPWGRAIALGLDENSKYLGYLPEYFHEKLTSRCTFSEAMGFSPLGFAQLKSNPISWKSLDDIQTLPSIGVVKDYVNSSKLDAKITNGEIKADEAVNDLENIKKLGAKRVPIIVIDENVLRYLLRTEPELAHLKDKVEMNNKLLEKKSLYLCFKKGEEGDALLDIFNKGLNKQSMKSFIRESFK